MKNTKPRLDLYGECNVEKAPVNQFIDQCCSKCINPECTRSQFGKTKFGARTATWHERLFTQVPRMDRDDTRYGGIAAQRFELIQPALTISSGWSEPLVVSPGWSEPPSQQVPIPAPSASFNTPVRGPQMVGVPASGGQTVKPGARVKLGG